MPADMAILTVLAAHLMLDKSAKVLAMGGNAA